MSNTYTVYLLTKQSDTLEKKLITERKIVCHFPPLYLFLAPYGMFRRAKVKFYPRATKSTELATATYWQVDCKDLDDISVE